MTKHRFLSACRREPVDCTPIWLMRQAGRYLPEYRRLRERYTLLEAIKTPELAVEITLQPLRRFALDAAIIFGDILPPLEAMGVTVDVAEGGGLLISPPVRRASDVAALRLPEAEEISPYTQEALRLARHELAERAPLIGFSGGPFTLAGYLIEGASSNYAQTKRFMYAEPASWWTLMGKLAQLVGHYLQAQVQAGAQVVQIFDSWAGLLSTEDYRQFALPHVQRAVAMARESGVPVIYFTTGAGGMLETIRECGADVIGIDWRVDLARAWRRIGEDLAIQGNLDPLTLFAPSPVLRQRAEQVLGQAGGKLGHIFNLGHGVLPETPIESVAELVTFVHEKSRSAS